MRLVSIIMLGMAGCTAVPPGSRMGEAGVEVPASWAARTEGRRAVDMAWLKRFHDAQLDALVEEAMRGNPDLKIAAARVDQAAQQARIVLSAARPSAQFGLPASRSRRNFVGFPDFGGGDQAASQGPPAEQTVLQSLNNSFGPSLDVPRRTDVPK